MTDFRLLAAQGEIELVFDEFAHQDFTHVVFNDVLYISGMLLNILKRQKHVFVLNIGSEPILVNDFFQEFLVQRFQIGLDHFILGIEMSIERHSGNVGDTAKFRNGYFTVWSVIQFGYQCVDHIF